MRMQIRQESQTRRQAKILHQEQGQANEEVMQSHPEPTYKQGTRA
jgi:hypothetical protein